MNITAACQETSFLEGSTNPYVPLSSIQVDAPADANRVMDKNKINDIRPGEVGFEIPIPPSDNPSLRPVVEIDLNKPGTTDSQLQVCTCNT